MNPVEQIAAVLATRPRPVVVGIDGAGGAGKSTLAAALAARLPGVVVIPIDDYIVKERVNDDAWDAVWDRVRLVAEVLEPFRAGLPVAHRRLEWDRNTLSDPIPLPAGDVLVVEGITTLHPDLADYVDVRVWVETDPALALERGRRRDAGNENEARWDAWAGNDAVYRATHRPHAGADVVVDGTAPDTLPD